MYEELFPKVKETSPVAQNILRKRYFSNGETDWFNVADRVVDYVNPSNKELMRTLIRHTYFVPNSPCLVNSGKEGSGLCACFVVDFNDTIEEIYKTKLEFALIARKGGGCGTTLSKIRPEGSKVAGSTHGYAGGPIKFADTISHDADALTQAGFRSMAIMFTMSVYHPDILKFITAKEEEGVIANANISVVVDNAFMQAVENDGTYWTRFNGENYKEYRARDVFDMMVEGAWRNGEPGVLFQDRIDDSPYWETGQMILATNPCSEQPLPPNGVCNLGSIDISKLLVDGEFDWKRFRIVAEAGTIFLDTVVDRSTYPTEGIAQWAKENRAIGLGIMGFADYCLQRKIAYGSKQSLDELESILKFMYQAAKDTSQNLGVMYGVPKQCQKLKEPRRNITLTTIAPTGTISLLAGCSSGIEPIFSGITIRNDKTGSYTFENDLVNQPYFRCAVASNGEREVTWEEHVDVLSSAQKYIDSGVSKTINFPTNTHRETMAKAILKAWKQGCKGLAMYRNGSRKVEVLSPKNLKKDKCPECGSEVIKVGNCTKCTNLECGWSLCQV